MGFRCFLCRNRAAQTAEVVVAEIIELCVRVPVCVLVGEEGECLRVCVYIMCVSVYLVGPGGAGVCVCVCVCGGGGC